MGVSEDKIEIVPNGIDLAEFENLPQRGEFRKKYGLDDSQKIILYLGRIHQTKGIDLLARAFADLTKELDRAKLVIVGPDDGYLPALKKLIKELKIEEKVIFTGPLYEEEKLKTYIDADVFVNPRADEIFGLVFLEALACGTPVICSRGCGIADVIDGQAGLAVPYDKDRLSDAILRMLSDDKMRQQFREKGKLLVRERYNWGKIVEQVEGLYRAVAK
jgi:glycosyltransferase involved in cell wall biosynthesis